MEYIARRPFAASEPGSRLVQAGEKVTVNSKSTAKDMIGKGLIWPNYEPEDPEEYKVEKGVEAHIEHDAGGMYYIKQGDKVLDRKRKSEAEALRDEINE